MGNGAGAAGYATIRPTSDVAGAKNFTGDGGASPVSGRMNDNNNATYGAGTGGSGQGYPNIWFAMTMGTVSPPATARIYRIRTRADFFRDPADSGHNNKVSLTPRCPGTKALVSSPRDYYETGSTSTQSKSGVWRNHDPDGREWTAARVNSTQFEIYGYRNNVGGGSYLRVAEVYGDVDIREKPTISGVTLTGASTTRPTGAWTWNANPDGDQQYWYRAKAFTAAQYGAAGFNPDTSAAFWDSGQVASSAASVTVGADLQNGVTYKFYVKAAQSFHTVPWYTDWASSSAFTVTLGPPADPTLTVTSDDTYQRAVVVVDANQNLLSAVDSDFESGTGTWTATTNCSVTASATQAASGTQSLRLSSTAAGDMSVTPSADVTPLVAGRTYTLHTRSRAGTTARTFLIQVDWKRADGTVISTSTASNTNSNANFATTAVNAFTAPAGTRSGRPRLVIQATGGAGELHYFDMVGIWPGTSTTWTSGGQAANVAILLDYLDAATGSRNLLPAQVATTGMVARGTAGFTGRAASDDVDFDPSTGTGQAEGSIRWNSGSAFSNLDVGIDQNALALFDPTYAFPVVPGKSYTLTVDLKASASFSSKLFLLWHGPTGTQVSTNSSTMTITTSFVRYSATGTAPAGAVWAGGSVENTASVYGVNVWASRAMLREGGSLSDVWVPGQADQRAWTAYHGWDAVTAKSLGGKEYQEDTVYDYELPRGRPRLYRARAVNSITGTAVGSAAYAYGAAEVVPDGFAYLVDPYHPWLSLRIATMSELGLSTEEAAEVVRDLGDNRPVVAADRLFGEDATLVLLAQGIDGIQAVQAISREQHTLILRSAWTDRQWPIRITSRAETPLQTAGGPSSPASTYSFGYVEVEPPS